MEDTEVQDVPKFTLPVLTKEDESRIRNCDFYLKAKEVIKSTTDYKEFEVGSAIFLKRQGESKFVSTDYEGKNPEKFIIVQNDEGFLFAKRINANGKPGVAVTCITIDYPSAYYEIHVDDGYIESMLLDTQDTYDPLADAKSLMKRKNKASRDNIKKRIIFDTHAEAHAWLQTCKVGDLIFSTDYSYGSGLTEYKIDTIERRPAVPGTGTGWSRNRGDEEYINLGFKEVIIVNLKVITSTKKYSSDTKVEYRYISREGYTHNFYYNVRPVSPEDLAK
jgi:hypothetical protein